MRDRVIRWMVGLCAVAALLAACVAPSKAPAVTVTPVPSATAAQTATASPTPKPLMPVGTNGFPWWNDAVFYEVFVRSFYDASGDGIGDFKGLTEKLDYLNDGNPNSTTSLGVNAIWLMPIHPSPSYHGYDVTDYTAINPDYGTLDDFKTFLKEAHKRGIKVIIDLVLNHTSDQHPWFIAAQDPKSDKRDWYVWSDTDPGYLGASNQKVWYQTPSGYYYAEFGSNMPDLNYRNPAVTQAMDDAVSFWLKDIGIDGFRIDAARYLVEDGKTQVNTPETHDWFKQFRTFYKGINADAFTVGEVWDTVYAAAPYAKGDEMDIVFAFDLAKAIVDNTIGRNGKKIGESIAFNSGRFKPGQFGIFLTNHDINRVMYQLQGDMGRMKAAAAIYLTAPGVPFIYYGEEIGMTGAKPDKAIRTPMQWSDAPNSGFTNGTPWESLKPDYARVNVTVEQSDPNSLLALYRSLIRLRSEHTALRIGDYFNASCDVTAVYSGLRAAGDEVILTVANLSDQPVSGCALKLGIGPLKGQYKVTPLLGAGAFADVTANDSGGFTGYQPLPELPAYAQYVLLLTSTP